MSGFLAWVEASPKKRYLFRCIIDHAPERGETEEITKQFQDAMATLGVSPDRVGVVVCLCYSYPEIPRRFFEEVVLPSSARFLAIVRILTEPGYFTEDPNLVSARVEEQFAKFAGVPTRDVRAIVLEDAYIEVDVADAPEDAP